MVFWVGLEMSSWYRFLPALVDTSGRTTVPSRNGTIGVESGGGLASVRAWKTGFGGGMGNSVGGYGLPAKYS